MGVYVHERCHACRASLTGGYIPNYYSIGEPLVECLQCGALNSQASKCNEWAIMDGWRRTKLVMLFTYWGLAYSIVLGLLVAFCGAYLMTGSAGTEASGEFLANNILWIAAVAVIGGLLLSFRSLLSAIRASNTRLSDPHYVAKLKRVSFLP